MNPILAAAVIVTYNVPIAGGGTDPFCRDLQAVMEAARKTPPFAAVNPASLPSFGFRGGCALEGGAQPDETGPVFTCGGPVSAADLAALGNLDVETARCLPPGSRRGRSAGIVRTTVFESRGVRVRIRDYGAAPGSEIGHSTRFTVARLTV